MILNNAPANEAVLSNVGEVGEFRIRNSAKAFNILSSGLYANKIRAVIRELSCNAVDSHVAAGRADTPFDVHLPTALEPTFSIRDYGTGLSHDQVTNIYTTYFESTKTNSNDFIGALGLGSKSPFSYTDNFTVTAIKDGRKGVYTAFINEAGVPSIALMTESETTDPNGVEIKFAVENRNDFRKFEDEARTVYTYFKLRPVVSGPDFEFRDIVYETENIIPGVHSLSGTRGTRAVMGNIGYPIDVPNEQEALGQLATLLNCGLEMHFDIGELDFQASREGLSYIPETIAAIKRKLEAVNAALAVVIATEADAITDNWDRGEFLYKKAENPLWLAAVYKYAVDTKFQYINSSHANYIRRYEHKIRADYMAKTFNINMLAFYKAPGSSTCTQYKANTEWEKDAKGQASNYSEWHITFGKNVYFVVNDTKIGALERAKYHWRNGGAPARDPKDRYGDDRVLVLNPADPTKPMDTAGFFAELGNPADSRKLLASTLKQKPRAVGNAMATNVTILRLGQRGYGGYYKERELVWKDAGKASDFEATETYFYLPLSGFAVEALTPDMQIHNVKTFVDNLHNCGIPELADVQIYGVRKTDHKWVKAQANWVNIQEHLQKIFGKVDDKLVQEFAVKEIDLSKVFRYTKEVVNYVKPTSQYVQFVSKFQNASAGSKFNRLSFESLCKTYGKAAVDLDKQIEGLKTELVAVRNRYPLLTCLRDYDIDNFAVAQYINMIDKEVN